MNASFERVVGGADAIATEAEGLGPKLQRQREIAVLRKRLDALKPRTDRAAGPPDAPFLAVHQKGVTVGLAMFERFEKLADLKSCEVLFSQIGAKLDMLDTLRTLLADARGASGPGEERRHQGGPRRRPAGGSRTAACQGARRDGEGHRVDDRQRQLRRGRQGDRRLAGVGEDLDRGARGVREPALQQAEEGG